MAAEVVLIVASVLLALALDEWRQGREIERRVDTALAAFRQEAQDNLDQIADRLPYHMTLRYRFDEVATGDPPANLTEVFARIPEWRGMHMPPLMDIAWDAALASDVFPHIDFQLTSRLAEVYRQQESLENRANQGVVALEPQNLTPENLPYTMQSTAIFMQDVVGAERNLYCLYRRLLPRLEGGGAEVGEHDPPPDTLRHEPFTDDPIVLDC